MRKEGECKKAECGDGHNTDVICRNFSQGRCRFDELRCRFLHLKVKEKTTGTNKERQSVNEKRKERKDLANTTKDEERSGRDTVKRKDADPEKNDHLEGEDGKVIDKAEDVQQNARKMSTSQGQEDFLGMDLRHDIWKEMAEVKADIRELTRELRQLTRKEREDQNQ